MEVENQIVGDLVDDANRAADVTAAHNNQHTSVSRGTYTTVSVESHHPAHAHDSEEPAPTPTSQQNTANCQTNENVGMLKHQLEIDPVRSDHVTNTGSAVSYEHLQAIKSSGGVSEQQGYNCKNPVQQHSRNEYTSPNDSLPGDEDENSDKVAPSSTLATHEDTPTLAIDEYSINNYK